MSDLKFFKNRPELKDYDAPEKMSFSDRKTFDNCPRQYYYNKVAYTMLITGPLLEGNILHKSVEKIISIAEEEGCESIADFKAAIRKKDLKVPDIIKKEMDKEFGKNIQNPRYFRQRIDLEDKTRDKKGWILKRINKSCKKLFKSSYFTKKDLHTEGYKGDQGPKIKFKKLNNGFYSEEWIRSPILGDWGQIDQLHISDDGIEIIDLKTGKPRPEDEQQLYFYQVLWTDDPRSQNRPVHKLTLEYTNPDYKNKELTPLTNEQINERRDQYLRKKEEVKTYSTMNDFITDVKEDCRNCFCRQICDDYWKDIRSKINTEKKEWIDLEITVEKDDRSYKIATINRKVISDDSKIKITFNENNDPFKNMMKEGEKFRILGAKKLSIEEGDEIPIIKIYRTTEVYLHHHYGL